MKITAILTALSIILVAVSGCAVSKNMLPIDYGTTADIVISADDIPDKSTAEPFETESEADMADVGTETDTSVIEQTGPVPVTESSAVEPITTNTDAATGTTEVNETEQEPMTTAAPPDTYVSSTATETVSETVPSETDDVPKTAETTESTEETTAAPETTEPSHTHRWIDDENVGATVCSVCGVLRCEIEGHMWIDATCRHPAYCWYCGTTDGGFGDHVYDGGICRSCGHLSDEKRSEWESEVIRLINDIRRENGLCELTVDSDLSYAARLRAQDMCDHGVFDHDTPTYGMPDDTLAKLGIAYAGCGENIAAGCTPQEAVEAWMDSDGHRANILFDIYTHIGCGFGDSGGNNSVWSLIFCIE